MKTRRAQGLRKSEGSEAENIVRDILKQHLPRHYSISINRNKGIDLYVTDGKIFNVEVKSAKEKIFQNRKGKRAPRVGTFQLKPEDYQHADFFGFVIKKVDDRLSWTGKTDVIFVDRKNIVKYIKQKNKFGKPVKISIRQLEKIPKMRVERRRWT